MSLKGRRLIFVAIYWCTAPASLPGQTRETDSLAILDVIDQHEAAMRTFQAEQQIKIYAADAVWINALAEQGATPFWPFLLRSTQTLATEHRRYAALPRPKSSFCVPMWQLSASFTNGMVNDYLMEASSIVASTRPTCCQRTVGAGSLSTSTLLTCDRAVGQ
jgi:hypothetical protein